MLISLNNLKINSFKNVNKILTENTKCADFKKNVLTIVYRPVTHEITGGMNLKRNVKKNLEDGCIFITISNKDFKNFLQVICESGTSSYELLQNVYSTHQPLNQEIPLALMISKKILGEQGAYRVHGGGFAGTIQAFVPEKLTRQYIMAMSDIYGDDSCYVLHIRNTGGCQVL